VRSLFSGYLSKQIRLSKPLSERSPHASNPLIVCWLGSVRSSRPYRGAQLDDGFDPTDKLSFSASYDTTQDKYRQTPYGLLDKDII
jgi:hypothetical protein